MRPLGLKSARQQQKQQQQQSENAPLSSLPLLLFSLCPLAQSLPTLHSCLCLLSPCLCALFSRSLLLHLPVLPRARAATATAGAAMFVYGAHSALKRDGKMCSAPLRLRCACRKQCEEQSRGSSKAATPMPGSGRGGEREAAAGVE